MEIRRRRGTFRLIAAGVACGLVGGWAIGLMMRNILFGVKATDLTTALTVLALVLGGAFIAAYVPAHRVLAIDPAAVLKRD